MSIEPNTVLQGDCLEVMRGMADKSVDLVVTSPPYEKARLYGELGFRLKGQAWVDWMVERVREMCRVCKGLVVVNCEGQTTDFRWSATPVLLMADLHRAGFNLRKPAIFHRVGICGSGGPDWLRNDYEFCICITPPGKLAWSNNTAMGHPPKWAPSGEMSHRLSDGTRRNQWGASEKSTGGERRVDGSIRVAKVRPSHRITKVQTRRKANGERARDGLYAEPTLANPGNTIQAKYTADEVAAMLDEASDVTHHLVGGGLMGNPLAHDNEAPFPETLPEFFIRSYCPPDGIVLDPFSGSGTTAAVAKRCLRRYIGIDARESQVKLAKRRLANVQRELIA